jgi:hypothetical protein
MASASLRHGAKKIVRTLLGGAGLELLRRAIRFSRNSTLGASLDAWVVRRRRIRESQRWRAIARGSPPLCVLVAGVPRSGSTWLFNASRLLLQTRFPQIHAVWVTDYVPTDSSPCHLVKVHRPVEVPFAPAIVLTSRRDLAESIASRIRMGWLEDTPDAIVRAAHKHRALYNHWHARSHFEADYAAMLDAPAAVIGELARSLGVAVSAERIASIAADLAAMTAPDGGRYDPITLLHPKHRAPTGTTEGDVTRIRQILLQNRVE